MNARLALQGVPLSKAVLEQYADVAKSFDAVAPDTHQLMSMLCVIGDVQLLQSMFPGRAYDLGCIFCANLQWTAMLAVRLDPEADDADLLLEASGNTIINAFDGLCMQIGKLQVDGHPLVSGGVPMPEHLRETFESDLISHLANALKRSQKRRGERDC